MVQALAVAGARWEIANFTNVFKVHISKKCKMKYSIKKFSRVNSSYAFKLIRTYFSRVYIYIYGLLFRGESLKLRIYF